MVTSGRNDLATRADNVVAVLAKGNLTIRCNMSRHSLPRCAIQQLGDVFGYQHVCHVFSGPETLYIPRAARCETLVLSNTP